MIVFFKLILRCLLYNFFLYEVIFAADLCNQESIKSINVPISSETRSKKFQYRFQFIEKSPLLPVVIIIPGGPGGTSISSILDSNSPFDFNQILWGLDEKYSAIFTDPRSRGCNSGISFRPEELSTEANVSDLYELIKNLPAYVLDWS